MNTNKNNEGGEGWLLLIVAVLVTMIVLSLCGCRSSREVEQYRELFRMENEQVTMMRDSIGRLHSRIDVLTRSMAEKDSVRAVSKDSVSTYEKVEAYRRDSVSTERRGDTVYVDRWHWDTRNYQLLQTKFRMDSISQNCKITELQDYVITLLDSITQIKENTNQQTINQSSEKSSETVIKEQTPWWVTALAWIGGACMIVTAVLATAFVRVRKEGRDDDR